MTEVSWLEAPPSSHHGVTWGVPWQPGALAEADQVALRAGGRRLPLDSWVTARWPDGSVKWTGHALGQGPSAQSYQLSIESESGAPSGQSIMIMESDEVILIDTGALQCQVPRSGPEVITALVRDGRIIAEHGRLISLLQSSIADDDATSIERIGFTGAVASATVEQHGTQRAVIKLEGLHRADQPDTAGQHREWLPFIIRLYFYAGSHRVRMVHTMIWDGDESADFLAGLGLRFDVPLVDQLHDRHLRLAGADGGFLSEAVRGLTGLRRDPGAEVREAQLAGQPTPPLDLWEQVVAHGVPIIPAWGDYTLAQLSSDGFTIRKRTKPGHGWVGISDGGRSAGFSYVGGISGGLGLALRDFWQSYPAQLDIRGAASERAESTVWLYAPQAQPMDLRFYHDGMGSDTWDKQLAAMDVTYEDYEPGFGTPYGIARTHELSIWTYESTPNPETLAADSALSQLPPMLRVSPEQLHSVGVFGDWTPVDRSNPVRAAIEDKLDFLFAFYRDQREQRRWYGFWNFGDIMHTYDSDRHVWRYDVGGFAWDNSELSPDLWLWLAYLRSGRSDIFRFAEAMTRHTGEVDVYHLGQWQGLGTRHNVQHWGCSAKQHRISNPAYRRIFYYLTADERVGDLMSELVGSDRNLLRLDPNRKVRPDAYSPGDPSALAVGLGTDYGALAATWLTEWERTGNPIARDKLLGTMSDIGRLKYGFLTGEAIYDLTTGRFDTSRELIKVSHLSAVFGLVEVCSELISLNDRFGLGLEEFTAAWLQYCRLFLASAETQVREVGQPLTGISLVQGHSRLTAYAAHRLNDPELARAAWESFNTNERITPEAFSLVPVSGPTLLHPIDEAPGVSTNGTAQFCLAAIQNLALIGDSARFVRD